MIEKCVKKVLHFWLGWGRMSKVLFKSVGQTSEKVSFVLEENAALDSFSECLVA
jgi:hypothetical protein